MQGLFGVEQIPLEEEEERDSEDAFPPFPLSPQFRVYNYGRVQTEFDSAAVLTTSMLPKLLLLTHL